MALSPRRPRAQVAGKRTRGRPSTVTLLPDDSVSGLKGKLPDGSGRQAKGTSLEARTEVPSSPSQQPRFALENTSQGCNCCMIIGAELCHLGLPSHGFRREAYSVASISLSRGVPVGATLASQLEPPMPLRMYDLYSP
ncbi:hypothetical protein ACJ73_05955 [Blastomyces percursus]|uniref:Uncharacterized protein n=1 Tax=Blastomyces percursus TaxID=1658174 RepID=A0A1J9QR47_9EURO|nr:hypothetical protein ACJ73_05955 [Blastomyces percursus]